MPIGATIGAAVIAGGATVASGAMASHAQTQAANTASSTALQVANTNNDFAQSIYNQNEGHEDPFINFGTAAGNNEMGLLLGNPPSSPSTGATWGNPAGTPATATHPTTGYTGPALGQIGSQSQMDAYLGYYQAHPEQDPGFTSTAPFHGDPYTDETSANAVLAAHNAYVESHPATTPAAAPAASAAAPAASGTPATANAAQSAWDTYKNSSEYTNRLNAELDAVGSKYAAGGAFESGAEKKAIMSTAGTFASNELATYMDNLYRQEALGAQSASSLAGVGTNLVSQVSANNTSAGNAAANAALVAGQGSANNWNNIGSAVGTAAGAIGGAFGSSYAPSGGYPAGTVDANGYFTGSGIYDGVNF